MSERQQSRIWQFFSKLLNRKQDAKTYVPPEERTYVATVCGHYTKVVGFIHDGDEDVLLDMSRVSGAPEYCLDCLGKMSIRCGWCNMPIKVGDGITLISPKPDYDVPETAVRYEAGHNELVGCMRMDCAPVGGFAGYWVPPGEALSLYGRHT